MRKFPCCLEGAEVILEIIERKFCSHVPIQPLDKPVTHPTWQSGEVTTTRKPWIVGVSGASGSPYAKSVLTALLDAGETVDLIVSKAARLTLLDETGFTIRDAHWQADLEKWLERGVSEEQVAYWQVTDFAAGPSSGSYPAKGMLVIPATSAACAGIARGLSKDLLQRAADVNLKEQRPVIIVSRETPLSRSHLVNQLELHDAGALILPATPGFYSGAKDLQQLVDFVAGRVLDSIGIPHSLYRRWEGELGSARKPD